MKFAVKAPLMIILLSPFSFNTYSHLDRDFFFQQRINQMLSTCQKSYSGASLVTEVNCFWDTITNLLNDLKEDNDLYTVIETIRRDCDSTQSRIKIYNCYKEMFTNLYENWERFFPPHTEGVVKEETR
ncbi:MAG: hypothetical protein OXB84_02425 [Halobacteriovoraceae bacterium]|nr:hypothetical protein [Halobacteriovoraceae bacterium]